MKHQDPPKPDSDAPPAARCSWPAWAELKAECDKRVRGRLQIRDALRRAAA
jgi:hypothetical protein